MSWSFVVVVVVAMAKVCQNESAGVGRMRDGGARVANISIPRTDYTYATSLKFPE